MARIRSIKPEFWSSEQVMECSPMARLLFIGLWNFCDDAGNHVNSERTIKAQVFPGDDITSADVRRMLDELSSNDLIACYVHEGKDYLHVTSWKKYQRIDRPSYKNPPFNDDTSSNDRRTIDEDSPPEGRGGERRGEEGSGGEEEEPSPTAQASSPASPSTDLLGEASESTVTDHPASTLLTVVLASYHEILPNCRRIAVLNPKRRKRIQAADKLARQVCKQQGWTYVPKDFWEAYFDQCLQDPWLRGEVPNPKNPGWKQNLDVLLAEDRFAEIMDRAIATMADAA